MPAASIRNDDNEQFFDENANNYRGNYHKISSTILKILNSEQSLQMKKFLDIGGGDCSFASLIKDTFPNLDVCVVDPSKKLLEMNNDKRIKKLHGSLPNKLNLDSKFDYISCFYVLHHLVGSSVRGSKELLKKSLITIKDQLNDDGYLIIGEMFYDGIGIETLPRTLIFYMLFLQNALNVKVPSREFLRNLNVCFYTRSELKSILFDCGFEIIEHNEYFYKDSFKKKLLLVKDFGSSLTILKKSK